MRFPLAANPKPCSQCAGIIERARDICLIRLPHSPRCMVSLTPCSTPAKNYFRLAHKIFIHRPKCLSAPQPSLHCAIEYLLYEIDLVTSYERRCRRSWDFINWYWRMALGQSLIWVWETRKDIVERSNHRKRLYGTRASVSNRTIRLRISELPGNSVSPLWAFAAWTCSALHSANLGESRTIII